MASRRHSFSQPIAVQSRFVLHRPPCQISEVVLCSDVCAPSQRGARESSPEYRAGVGSPGYAVRRSPGRRRASQAACGADPVADAISERHLPKASGVARRGAAPQRDVRLGAPRPSSAFNRTRAWVCARAGASPRPMNSRSHWRSASVNTTR